MNKIKTIIALSLISMIIGCGLFSVEEKEDPAKKKREDSIAEIDRSDVLNNADKLLKQADSLDQAKKDSVNKATAESKK
jgi:uncharacterized protein YpmB